MGFGFKFRVYLEGQGMRTRIDISTLNGILVGVMMPRSL